MEEEQVIKGDILIQNGRIAAIGHVETEDEVCIDLNGKRVYPGMVEAHCHLGMEESAIRSEGNDVNESSDPITPQVRGIDGCYPLDETIVNARNAGITTVAAGPEVPMSLAEPLLHIRRMVSAWMKWQLKIRSL